MDDPAEPLAHAMLDAPWELLANRDGFLADDAVQIFEVARRIDRPREAIAPRHRDLQLLFMAAAPRGASALDFEAEEAAILAATERLPLHLAVEESGMARLLKERLAQDGPFEALHLSCHGDVHPRLGHVLALEDEAGDLAPATAAEVVDLLGDLKRTPLVFLSACRTAEEAQAAGDGRRRAEPLVREMVRAGAANVLGWDGSVYGSDATAFAEHFYHELAAYAPVPRAAAQARLALRQARQQDPRQGQHWHLARLYLGPQGGGALAGQGLPGRTPPSAGHEEQFLDSMRHEVPVAKRWEFVGRRRQAQDILRAFRDGAAGALIHGMGNLGKSSLAARIPSRLTSHAPVVVFRAYDGLTIFDRLLEAVPARERAGIRKTWRQALVDDAAVLADALEDLLTGPLQEHPVLLIIDDLEQILETPRQSDQPSLVRARFRPTLAAVLRAFAKTRSRSRSHLLVTSRYRFTLTDGRGNDLAAGLVPIPLQPMPEGEREKQLRAAVRAEKKEAEKKKKEIVKPAEDLIRRALAAAEGNPGLQAVLVTPPPPCSRLRAPRGTRPSPGGERPTSSTPATSSMKPWPCTRRVCRWRNNWATSTKSPISSTPQPCCACSGGTTRPVACSRSVRISSRPSRSAKSSAGLTT
ncbi:MAG: CHAT domain-containing protein [Thermodesulfobacteriota bacterium]